MPIFILNASRDKRRSYSGLTQRVGVMIAVLIDGLARGSATGSLKRLETWFGGAFANKPFSLIQRNSIRPIKKDLPHMNGHAGIQLPTE